MAHDESKTEGAAADRPPAFGPRQQDLDPIAAGRRAAREPIRTSTAGAVVANPEPRDEMGDYDAHDRPTVDPRASPPFAHG